MKPGKREMEEGKNVLAIARPSVDRFFPFPKGYEPLLPSCCCGCEVCLHFV